MSFREFLKKTAKIYFIIVTLICFATFLLGILTAADARFGYEAFLSPLINGFFGMIPVIVMYSPKELTMKQLVIRKIIQLVSIELVMFILLYGNENTPKTPDTMMGLFFTVIIIFILVHVIMYLLDARQAIELNKDLQNYQKNGNLSE